MCSGVCGCVCWGSAQTKTVAGCIIHRAKQHVRLLFKDMLRTKGLSQTYSDFNTSFLNISYIYCMSMRDVKNIANSWSVIPVNVT